jgi:hypothetical protein
MFRNLISLSTLDANGYKYYAGDDLLKITKRSLVVMKGDLNSINLYVLYWGLVPWVPWVTGYGTKI